MQTFVNLTPNVINLPGITLTPDGTIARITTVNSGALYTHSGVTMVRMKKGDVIGVPDPIPGVMFIVSEVVREALPHRMDLASPGGLWRNENGITVDCLNLVVN